MPHVVHSAATRRVLRDVVEIGRAGDGPALRFERTASGDAVVMAPSRAWIDGRAVLGGLAVVDWGRSALLRAAGTRVVLRWEATRELRVASFATVCGVCFGRLAAGETTAACACDAPAHPECGALLISCPACGAPGGGEATT